MEQILSVTTLIASVLSLVASVSLALIFTFMKKTKEKKFMKKLKKKKIEIIINGMGKEISFKSLSMRDDNYKKAIEEIIANIKVEEMEIKTQIAELDNKMAVIEQRKAEIEKYSI